MTYIRGLRLRSTTIASDQIASLCALLQREYTLEFHGEYLFRPEKISGGGIVFEAWPGKKEGQYKTMRLAIADYPWITEATYTQWQTDTTASVFKMKPCTFLKAFHGAPKWKVSELIIWTRCFEAVGIRVVNWKSRLTQKILDKNLTVCGGAVNW